MIGDDDDLTAAAVQADIDQNLAWLREEGGWHDWIALIHACAMAALKFPDEPFVARVFAQIGQAMSARWPE